MVNFSREDPCEFMKKNCSGNSEVSRKMSFEKLHFDKSLKGWFWDLFNFLYMQTIFPKELNIFGNFYDDRFLFTILDDDIVTKYCDLKIMSMGAPMKI